MIAEPLLLGVDVGFSTKRRTTGLAWYRDGQIALALAGSSWLDRQRTLPEGLIFSRIAFDAPLVPSATLAVRACEAVFYGRPFWNRCRPGLSHHGRGLPLRDAGKLAGLQFAAVLAKGARTLPVLDSMSVEAFPNAFLGVLTPEPEFESRTIGKRRSDWLFDVAVRMGTLEHLLHRLGWSNPTLANTVVKETNHDKRAALICLLTAAFAERREATVVGDPVGGWFWLPPLSMWQVWAKEGLLEAYERAKQERFPSLSLLSPPEFTSALDG